MDIRTVDCHYVFPQFAASFLLVSAGRACFVETNTSHSLPFLLDALEKSGVPRERVDWILVTHAHLDHAAGTSALMRACPNAKLMAHPKAARHLIDPSRLVSSARGVYGNERFERLYGAIDPIPAERVQIAGEGHTLVWQDAQFEFWHTLGHASHHVCIVEKNTRTVFTGDSFGVCYPELQGDGLFILASTSPTDFDPERALETVERIRQFCPDGAYLTHFGRIDEIEAASRALSEDLRFAQNLLTTVIQGNLMVGDEGYLLCKREIEGRFGSLLGARWKNKYFREILATDIDINAQGIVFAARRLSKSP